MPNHDFTICAKGSRKTGPEFTREMTELTKMTQWIEVDFNYPHDHNFEKEIEFLVKLNKEQKIHFIVHAQYLNGNLGDLNKVIRKESVLLAKYSIDRAVQLSASTVVMHASLEPYGLKVEDRLKFEREAYQEIADYASDNKIRVGLENEAQTCFWFPDRACHYEMLKETVAKVDNEYFGHTYDIGHAFVTGENYIEGLQALKDRLFHIHAHDGLGRPEKNLPEFNRPDPHRPPGEGKIDWKSVIEKLEEINYKKTFTLECEIHDMENAINYINSL